MTTFDPSLNEITLTQKIYKIPAIRVATFLGGPLVAGYLIAENFKAFGERDKAKRAWLFAIIATIVIFSTIFLAPGVDKVPRIVLPLIYSWVTSYIVQNYQGTQIDAHLNMGGEAYSWWRAIAVSLIGAVVTLIPVFIIALILMK